MAANELTVVFKQIGLDEVNAKMDQYNAKLSNLVHNTNGTVNATGKVAGAMDSQANATDRATKATDRASRSQGNYFAHIAKTTVQSALVNKAFLGLTNAAGAAVKQVDLFNNFPASMAALGLSAKDASESFNVLKSYVAGVGGDLTTATTSVARFAEVTKNVKAATAEFIGVNNALIAGGAGAQVQANGLEQLIQAYSRGVPQLIEWKSLMVAMPAQLNQVAEAMNFKNAQALGESLTQGETSMQSFITKLTQLSTGTGPIAQQAIARMQGIEYASNVLKNALTNGLAAIYQAVGRQNIINFFNFLTQVIIVLAGWAVNLINILISLFNIISKVFGGPQIAHFNGEAQGVANSLEGGADAAGDMGDNLDDAADSAKKLNKGLASFDKMNVLADKDSGSSGKDKKPKAGGQNGLGGADAAALGDIFGKIEPIMTKIGTAAKVFAGILAGLVGLKFASSIINQVDDIAKSFAKAGGAVGKFKDGVKGIPGVVGKGLEKVGNFPLIIGGKMDGLKGTFASFGKFLTNPYVLAAAAVAALVGGIVYLYNKNEDFKKGFDKIWKPILDLMEEIGKTMVGVIGGAIKFLIDQWNKVKPAFQPVFDLFAKGIEWLKKLSAEVGITGGFMENLGKVLGIVGAAIALYVLGPLILLVAGLAAVVAGFIAIVAVVIWVFQTAADIITAFIKFTIDFFQDAWLGIRTAWANVVSFFTNLFADAWTGMKMAWANVTQWFKDQWTQVQNAFSAVVTFFRDLFTAAWDAIKFVWNAAPGFFLSVWNNVKSAFGDIAGFFGNAFQGAFNRVTSVFAGLYDWFRVNVWDRVVSLFSNIGASIGNAVGDAFKGVINTAINWVSNMINNVIRAINGAIGIINKIPKVEISTIPSIALPRLAKGGVVDRATTAIIGENGAEAVVPLENNLGWIETLASKINDKQGTGTAGMQLVVQIGEDKIATKMIDLINEKTNMSGRNTIYV